jgi:hypothetical protein
VTDADIQFGAPRVRRLGDQVAEQIGGSARSYPPGFALLAASYAMARNRPRCGSTGGPAAVTLARAARPG